MYKLINIRNTSFQNYCKTSNVEGFTKFCVFCNFYHRNVPKCLTIFDYLQLRYHSSNTSSVKLLSNVKLKRKKKLKKYAELLEVTNSVTNNTKASIKSLKAEYFSRLVDKPDITLDKLHEIENKYYIETEGKNKSISNIVNPVNSINQDTENTTNLIVNLDYKSLKNLTNDQNFKNVGSLIIDQNSINLENSANDNDSKNKENSVIDDDSINLKNSRNDENFKNLESSIIDQNSLNLESSINDQNFQTVESSIIDQNSINLKNTTNNYIFNDIENTIINQDSINLENAINNYNFKNVENSIIDQNFKYPEYINIEKNFTNSGNLIINQSSENSLEQESKHESLSRITPFIDNLSSDSMNNTEYINLSERIDHVNIMHKVEYAHTQNNFNLKSIINFSNFEKFINSKPKSNEFEEDTLKMVDKEFKSMKKQLKIDKLKLKQYNALMLAYTNVCVNCNDVNLFDKILTMCKKSKQDDLFQIIDINIFNIIIEKLSQSSNFLSIIEIFNYLRQNKVRPNIQTYTYIFNCIGLMKYNDEIKLDYLNHIITEMKYDGISLNDIVTKSILVNNQRDVIGQVVKLVDKNFNPNFELQDSSYDCKLLNSRMDSVNIPSTVEGFSHMDLINRLKKQMEMEMDGQVVIRSIAKPTASFQEIKFCKKILSDLENTWEKLVNAAFEKNLTTLKNIENSNLRLKIYLHPYLCILDKKYYVQTIMRKIRDLGLGSELYSLSYYNLCQNLGLQIFNIYELNLKQNYGINDKTFDIYWKYSDWFIKRNDKLNCREKWMLLEHELNQHGASSNREIPNWPNNTLVSIGMFLFNIILNELKFHPNSLENINKESGKMLPAFFKLFRHKGMKLEAQIKTHPLIAKLYRDANLENLSFPTTLVPSICPPRPWTNVQEGGYIISKSTVIRMSHTGNVQWEKLNQTKPKQLYPSLDSLNQLGSIPWTINTKILDLAIEIFRKDGSEKLNIPQPASVLTIPTTSMDTDLSDEEQKNLHRSQTLLKAKKLEMHGLWCEALYRLSLANHFKNEIFWFPHNMDFRGRVYPIPPLLSHLTYDLGRSMLVFALKKPLGPKGLDWLKLHLINLTGLKKKEPIAKRLEYADTILDKILDSAENPLTGKMWWTNSDNPWQTLAACIEVAEVLKSPDPEKFKSGFPIHQDGSCNGLQHYAALGRDVIGAESVNLSSSEVPKDVYNNVAVMIEELRIKDAEKGIKIAKLLEGCVQRKVIKQTVMTTVYGVTFYGAKLQIARQLEDLNKLPQKYVWEGAVYLVNKTFLTLRSMFTSAREIQDWFTQCCGIICKTKNKSMEWVTPLGLPIVQPYSKQMQISSKNIVTYYITKPNTTKQKNAFPPNFIHSLDSTHMMLTSIHSDRAGITFVSVHDCFWTHPCSVEIMNKICREQFVSLHSEPILEDLAQFLLTTFVNDNEDAIEDRELNDDEIKLSATKKKLSQILKRVPKRGEFNLKEILSSTYFFS